MSGEYSDCRRDSVLFFMTLGASICLAAIGQGCRDCGQSISATPAAAPCAVSPVAQKLDDAAETQASADAFAESVMASYGRKLENMKIRVVDSDMVIMPSKKELALVTSAIALAQADPESQVVTITPIGQTSANATQAWRLSHPDKRSFVLTLFDGNWEQVDTARVMIYYRSGAVKTVDLRYPQDGVEWRSTSEPSEAVK